MAAAIRFLRRRAAPVASPSLALLQPLLPAPHSKPRPPLMAAAATVARFFPGVGPEQSSPYSQLRRYSSKGSSLISPGCPYHCCQPAQHVLLAALKASNATYDVVKDMHKMIKVMEEALKTLLEAGDLLDAGWEDKAFSMFEKGIDDALKGVALHEKVLDDLAKGFGSIKGVPLHILEPQQMRCKEFEKSLKSWR
ncbi:hypothetical protein ACP4OV_019270 [Aristida adscensionis]